MIKADEQGKWQTTVATPSRGPYEILIASGKRNIIKLKMYHLKYGFAPQSNMEWRVRNDIKT